MGVTSMFAQAIARLNENGLLSWMGFCTGTWMGFSLGMDGGHMLPGHMDGVFPGPLG